MRYRSDTEDLLQTLDFPLAKSCFAFGPSLGGASGSDSATTTLPASSPTAGADATPSSPVSSSSVTSCKIKGGLSGRCISTSACSSGGGNSEAGHCPGAADIQVFES